ncbi:MAG: protein TolR [Thermodesulfobacteriota bacterium]
MKAGGSNDSMMSEINVTPFVDVMLVLLIIFMVTAPMMVQGVDVSLPEASNAPLKTEENQLVVSINKDAQVYINDVQVDSGFLQEKLVKVLENRRDRNVFLRADKTIPYGLVVKVMSDIKNAGVEKLGMLTEPEEKTNNKTGSKQ